MNALIGILVVLIGLVVVRWSWIVKERGLLSRFPMRFDERFDPENSDDEDDRIYRGRIIDRLRSHLIEGRVEIHWEFRPEFIHRGFVVTAKSRRNDGDWQILAMEPFQDSGSWIECFNYGESRSYVFTVKKHYQFFFGLFGELGDETVYDQISFSVRKGKYLKEKRELMRDRRELLGEVKEYVKAEQEIRQMMKGRPETKPLASLPETVIQRLEKRRMAQVEFADYMETETAKINSRSDWSDDRKAKELQRLHEMATEMALEE